MRRTFGTLGSRLQPLIPNKPKMAQQNLPKCPKGCSVPSSTTTVVLYKASRGINDYCCVVCNFRSAIADDSINTPTNA